jgi:glycosyltransferase involved in cell wall biosynthesis
MANTVSLCMIVKNEEKNIAGLLGDVCPVLEEIHIVDTGSTDNTLEILKTAQGKHPNLHVHHFEWVDNFSKARNFSFSHATQDWIFWVDGDDRVDPTALKHFKENLMDDPAVDCWILPYLYSKYPDGSPSLTLGRERFLRRSATFTWAGAIHETIGIWNLRQREYNALKIDHCREGKILEAGRNLRILEKEYAKNPDDPRTAYYTAKERFDAIQPRAKEGLLHYLTLDGRFYDDEIGARFRLAKIYLSEQNHGEAIRTIEPVYHLDITRRRSEYYFIFGEVESALQNYEVAIEWYDRCVKEPPPPPRVLNLEYWTWHPLKKMAMCHKELGNWPKALEYSRRVQKLLPGDPDTEAWVKSYKSVRLEPQQNYKLTTMEFGTRLRYDSWIAGEHIANLDHKDLPYADEILDGAVLGKQYQTLGDLGRIIRPGGFLWCENNIIKDGDFQFLGSTDYLKTFLYFYVKKDTSKPVIGYGEAEASFAPYRYRVLNLLKSAVKKGYPITKNPAEADFYVGLNLKNVPKPDGKIFILEVCEELGDYGVYGVEKADVINASSPGLKQYLKIKYPDKKVINVDDHYEMPNVSWL